MAKYIVPSTDIHKMTNKNFVNKIFRKMMKITKIFYYENLELYGKIHSKSYKISKQKGSG